MTLLDPEKMLHNPWADILWVKPLLSCSPCLLILLVWVCFSLYCFLVFSLEISHPASLASRLVTMLFSPPHLDTFLSLSSCGAASSCLFLTSAQAHFSFFALLFLGLFVFSLKVKMMPEISPKQVCKIVNVCLKWQIIPLYVHIWINYIYLVYND